MHIPPTYNHAHIIPFILQSDSYSLYCMYSFSYEIQLIPDVRRKGLGKFLMQILELIGHKACMKKIVLTVFNPLLHTLK